MSDTFLKKRQTKSSYFHHFYSHTIHVGILRSISELWYFCHRKRLCDFCKVIDHVCMKKKRWAVVNVTPSCRGDRGTSILTRCHDLGDFSVRAKISEAPCSPPARTMESYLFLTTGTNHSARSNLEYIKSIYRALGWKDVGLGVVILKPLTEAGKA